jgi:hypothetical protein
MDPVPHQLLARKSDNGRNRTRNLWVCSQKYHVSLICVGILMYLGLTWYDWAIQLRNSAFIFAMNHSTTGTARNTRPNDISALACTLGGQVKEQPNWKSCRALLVSGGRTWWETQLTWNPGNTRHSVRDCGEHEDRGFQGRLATCGAEKNAGLLGCYTAWLL